MFAVLSTAWVVPGLIGPAIAAVVATSVGWRWVFLGLLPLVVVAGVLASLAMRHVPPPARVRRATVPYFPVLGVVAGAGLALASVSSGYLPGVIGGSIVGGALLAVSLRRLTPPGTLTAKSGLPATVLSRGLLTCCFFAGDAFVPYTLTTVRHSPTTLAALALTASTLMWAGAAWVQARWVSRLGPRRLVRTGECLVVAGLGVMGAALVPSLPPALGVLAWGIAGGGIGLAYTPLSLTTLESAAPGAEGQATSGLQLCDVLGQALGTGVAGALVAAAAASGLSHRSGVGFAFSFAIIVGAVAIIIGVRLPKRLSTSEIATSEIAAPELTT